MNPSSLRATIVVEHLQPRQLLSTIVPGKPVLPLNPQGAFITNPNDPFPRPRAVLGDSRTLEVFGTFENDTITLRVRPFNGTNRVFISVNGRERVLLLSRINRINIVGDFGDDNIRIEDDGNLLVSGNRRTRIFGDNPDQADFFGNDTIGGTNARDNIDAGPGEDKVEGRGGNDTIEGGLGADTLSGGAGNDTLRAGGQDAFGLRNELLGEQGNDSIDGGNAKDFINGGVGNDTINGGLDADVINTGPGDDFVRGGSGSDILYGVEGNDTLYGDLGDVPARNQPLPFPDHGNDTAYGGVGNDSLWGEGGEDELFGGDGSDTLLGHFGVDNLSGNDGDDYLNGHEEADRVSGGPGRDLFNLIDLTAPSGQTDFNASRDNRNARPRQATFGSEELPIDIT